MVYVGFDTNLSKHLVDEVVGQCQAHGVCIRGLVFDNGNPTLLKGMLEQQQQKTTFLNLISLLINFSLNFKFDEFILV